MQQCHFKFSNFFLVRETTDLKWHDAKDNLTGTKIDYGTYIEGAQYNYGIQFNGLVYDCVLVSLVDRYMWVSISKDKVSSLLDSNTAPPAIK